LQRFGKYIDILVPGLHKINPFTDKVIVVDHKKIKVMDLQRQLILTKDNISVNIDTVVYFRIIDPKRSTYRVNNIGLSVEEVTYATLRTICGEHLL